MAAVNLEKFKLEATIRELRADRQVMVRDIDILAAENKTHRKNAEAARNRSAKRLVDRSQLDRIRKILDDGAGRFTLDDQGFVVYKDKEEESPGPSTSKQN